MEQWKAVKLLLPLRNKFGLPSPGAKVGARPARGVFASQLCGSHNHHMVIGIQGMKGWVDICYVTPGPEDLDVGLLTVASVPSVPSR